MDWYMKENHFLMKSRLLLLLTILLHSMATAQCWNLVWADEFNGTAMDGARWDYEIGAGGWGNNELQYYTDRPENTTVSDGTLKIMALSEAYMGADYTSARLRTKGLGDWKYGKFEARIKMPEGQGIWPAFWMLPSDKVYGGWPSSGEIDIMECLGHQPDIIYGTAHWGNSPTDKGSSGNSVTHAPGGDYADGFYTYTVEWEPTQIRWYLDGVPYHTLSQTDIPPGYFWPFDQDFHFLLNIAVGGNWPGYPDGTTAFPQTMEVDYVRVYQLLPDIAISGDVMVEPGGDATYSVPDIPGTSYLWTIPSGSIITSGAGTSNISVTFGGTGGTVGVDMVNACGTSNSNLEVAVSSNLSPNPGFEFDFSDWIYDVFNSASANFNINNSDVHSGNKSMCVEVNAVGTAAWEVQLSPLVVLTETNEEYTLSFWAKADVSGRQMSVALIHNTTFAYYGGQSFTLSDQWAEYTYFYTAPEGAETQINLEFGHETGTFCVDDFHFGRTVSLPLEMLSFSGDYSSDGRVYLNWETVWEENFSHFEVERSVNGVYFEPIGLVQGGGDGVISRRYQYSDAQVPAGQVYYRLRQYDKDSHYTLSEVVTVQVPSSKTMILDLYPNPVCQGETVLINFHASSQTDICVTVNNAIGEQVAVLDFKTKEGYNAFPLLNQSWGAGIFFLHVDAGDYSSVLRLVMGN
jgi:beta-glucanase (GH16 family)